MDENPQMQPSMQMNYGAPPEDQVIVKMARDMKFMAIWTIIGGSISCIYIISAVIGIPIIIAGIRLKDAADLFKSYLVTRDPGTLQMAFEKQWRYFYINKVIILVYLGIVALGLIILIIILLVGGLATFQRGKFV